MHTAHLFVTLQFIILTIGMRKLLYISLWAIACGLVGSCNGTEGDAAADDSTALRVGVLPTMECLPFYYADSMGVFDSVGLDVTLVTFGAAMDADTAFANGLVDGVATDLVKACVWNGQGDSVRVAIGADLQLWLVASPGVELRGTDALKEKIVGITRHSAVDFFADKVLEMEKLESQDLNKPQINNLWTRMQMVLQKQYDGAVLPEPYAMWATAKGAERLWSIEELGVKGMMCVVFGDSVYRAREVEMEKLRMAYGMATEALNADTTEDKLAFLPLQQMSVPDSLYRDVVFKPSVMPSDSMMQVVREWAQGRGLIE